ncbi:restriction endonuclease [Alteromonas lipolytica]|uniref:Restriction endonuclease type IV Mrr domain-containing protein n=1 Tax=Alteromonas lipolytica TaxID=1856405 RepID=A0A1E8FG33_9ALTE|nr:restriction endonuclease [Alteromonas lipolytica]OFI34548.1 hypothetical protein BFC17_13185 [Alteromonas lipolytica]GGF51988.1 hypothetical protein GCM10011338_00110 [Alteromonas lipolytica]
MNYDAQTANIVLLRSPVALLAEGFAGIGWGQFDLSNCHSAEEVDNCIEASGHGVGRSRNQLRRFAEIKQGDIIVVPAPARIFIGIATGKKRFCCDFPWGENQVGVDFFSDKDIGPLSIARSELMKNLQARLRIRLTVADLNYFREEILGWVEQMASNGSIVGYSALNEKKEALLESFKLSLLSNLRQGKHYLKAGGEGLEVLVKELLELEGYNAVIPSKNTYEAGIDVDIVAEYTGPFLTQKLLVQVKDHTGMTSAHGLEQLLRVPEKDDYNLCLISLGEFDQSVTEKAGKKGVTLMDGNAFVEWLSERVDELSPATQQKLGLVTTPSIIIE